jgi:hypothetical protein
MNLSNLATAFILINGTLGDDATSIAVIGATAATTGIQVQSLIRTDINKNSRLPWSLVLC